MANNRSSLINFTIPNLVAGVSQQFEENRFETQVSEMINCIPTISRGIIRRNPLNVVSEIQTGLNSSTYIYTYDRGTEDEQYSIEIDINANWYVRNLNTGTLISQGYSPYFVIPAGRIPKECFEAVTVGDYSFILNKTITVKMNELDPYYALTKLNEWKRWSFYWIKKTAGIQTDTSSLVSGDTTRTGVRLEGYTYTLLDKTNLAEVRYTTQGVKDTRSNVTQISRLKAEEIAADLATKHNSFQSTDGPFVLMETADYVFGRYVYKDFGYEDSFGNEASLLIHKQVTSASLLPVEFPVYVNKIIRISGYSSSEYDDYWMRYDGDLKEWSECAAPEARKDLDYNTMPHVIVRKNTGDFVCSPYDTDTMISLGVGGEDIGWRERIAGDENTLPNPSFVGNTIDNIFLIENRLGLLSGGSVVLSEIGVYGNYFGTTAQSLPEDDPIDLFIATNDVALLKKAVSTTKSVVLFSDKTQFSLEGSGGSFLSPSNATVNVLSNYNYTSNAIAIANKIYFISEAGGYSQLFAYKVAEGIQVTEAEHLTAHIPTYIPKDIHKVVGHSTLGYIFMHSLDTPNTIYVLNTFMKDNVDVQNAFHKWEFNINIVNISIIRNKLYIHGITEDDKAYLTVMDLEIKGSITSVNYTDGLLGDFTSLIRFSEFGIKDEDGVGTRRGRLQIRTIKYFVSRESYYMSSIYNSKYLDNNDDPRTILGKGLWDDLGILLDIDVWRDNYPAYVRNYYQDSKVTVMGNSRNTQIEFKSNEKEPNKGFELSTVNVEAFFYQRSMRI